MAPKITRKIASDGPKSATGQQRGFAYKRAWEHIKHAKAQECWLEVIALVESMLSDRLEARYAHLFDQAPDGRKVPMGLGHAARRLRDKNPPETSDLNEIYDAVQAWAQRRNTALHGMVKVFEQDTLTDWDARTAANAATAKDGEKLFRKLDRKIREANSVTRPNKRGR